MTSAVIITFCILLLIAYLFDITSLKTKIPSVILLLLLGWVVKQITSLLSINLPDLTSILPIFGTIGLILIVLEGSLELELNKSKTGLILKSFFGALLPIIAMSFLLAYLFRHFGDYTLKYSLTNAIPFCIISSAIAIPSVRYINKIHREFVIYESSLSDILGVIFFNFIAFNETFGSPTFARFGLQLLLIIVVSFIATIGLSYLLSKINHHIKFIPIFLLVILIYTISKIYHLPALIFILFFGLSIGNLDEFKRFKWIEKFRPDILSREVLKLKDLTAEFAFLIRALFFLLFGYLLDATEILNLETLEWAIGIVLIFFSIRIIQLKLSNLPLLPLLFIAPRGLITILLFLSIDPEHKIALVNNSLIIQVILISSLVMMLGLMLTKKNQAV